MTTELKLTNICGHTSVIKAGNEAEGTRILIETTCPKIQKWGTDFIVPMEDMMDASATLAKNDEKGKTTPTCFIPTLIRNAIWLENGMISKNLAKKSGIATIEYSDE